jgi:hypothetical protein
VPNARSALECGLAAIEHAQLLDLLQYFLDLSRGMRGRRFPKRTLHRSTVLARSLDSRSPLRQQRRGTPFDDGTGQSCLVLTVHVDDRRPQITIAQHDQSMLLKPATCKLQQPLPIAGTGHGSYHHAIPTSTHAAGPPIATENRAPRGPLAGARAACADVDTFADDAHSACYKIIINRMRDSLRERRFISLSLYLFWVLTTVEPSLK